MARATAGRGIAAVAFFAVGLLALVAGGYLMAVQVRLQLTGVRVEGEVIQLSSRESQTTTRRGGYLYSHFATVRFQTPDGQTVETECQVTEAFRNASPKTVIVIFDPSDPQRNVLAEGYGRWVVPGMIVTFGIFFIGFTPIIWPRAVPELEAEADAALITLHPPGPRSKRRKPLRGRFMTGIMVLLMWNSLLSVLVWAAWRESAWVPLLLMSPLILIGVLMVVSLPYGIYQYFRPFIEVKVDRDPMPGEAVRLYWRTHGFAWLLGRLTIELNPGPRRDPAARTVVDTDRKGGVSLGRTEVTIPEKRGQNAWHLLVGARHRLGLHVRQVHPIPGPPS